jgi:HPt (histidine-containing phosphotransfer) domain-containing protein
MDAYVPKPINVQELLAKIKHFFPMIIKTSTEKNKTQDDEKICNWNSALARLGGETEILEMLMNLFLEEQSSYLENIKNALAAEDSVVLQRELHTLRGVCATIGAEKIEKSLKKPEADAAQQDFLSCAAAMPELEQDLLELACVLRKKMNLN